MKIPEKKILKIAEDADLIVKGYAFKKNGDFIHVFNMNDGFSAMVIDNDGTMIETNMDDIQQALVKQIGILRRKLIKSENWGRLRFGTVPAFAERHLQTDRFCGKIATRKGREGWRWQTTELPGRMTISSACCPSF